MPSKKTFGGPAFATLLSVAVLTGCGDRNIGKLTVGITRDSVLKILATGSTAADSTPNVYREERYLHDGQFITLLMYTPTGKKEATDTLPEEQLIPVVLRNDTLMGWGWEYTDSVASMNNIVLKPRAK